MHNSSLGCWSLTSSLWDGKTAYNGGFFISAVPPMKTTLYIDGFNLYYGVLKGSPYKWLDVVKLFTHIGVASRNGKNSTLRISERA